MFDETGFTLSARTRRETGQEQLDRAAAGLFALFGEREKEFSFNSAVVVEYPDIADTSASPLLHDPVGYFEGRIAALEHDGEPIGRTVVLTTFGDRLHAPLSTAGYSATPIDMPAGPDFTWWFEKVSGAGRTLYLEAVASVAMEPALNQAQDQRAQATRKSYPKRTRCLPAAFRDGKPAAGCLCCSIV